MKPSFYNKVIIAIYLLIGIEITIKLGIHKAVVPLVCETVIIIILLYFLHKANRANDLVQKSTQPNDPLHLNASRSINDTEWQRRHDQWWQTHYKLTLNQRKHQQILQLERHRQFLKNQINSVNQKIQSEQRPRYR